MDINSNSINWFEIPARDIARAKKFYETIFNIQMSEMMEMMGMKMVGFPGIPGDGKVNGALVQSEVHTPMMDGCVLYLNANPKIQEVLDRSNCRWKYSDAPHADFARDWLHGFLC